MRATLLNEDGSFLAEVDAPDGTGYIRFGERFFDRVALSDPAEFQAVEVYVAPTEGALVVEP